jgi:hypothetical protein
VSSIMHTCGYIRPDADCAGKILDGTHVSFRSVDAFQDCGSKIPQGSG